jgi:lia operon protein LiaF
MYRNRWMLFLGVVFIILGLVWLWNNLGIGPQIPICDLWPLIFVAIGAYILLRQTAWANRPDANTYRIDHILSPVRMGGTAWDMKNTDVVTLVGDIDIDLRQARFAEGETVLRIRCLAGDVSVLVPEGIPVRASASLLAGDVNILGQRRDGIFQDITISAPDYATATRKLRIDAALLAGEVEIR